MGQIKIGILSTHNLFCQKFAVVFLKFLTHDVAGTFCWYAASIVSTSVLHCGPSYWGVWVGWLVVFAITAGSRSLGALPRLVSYLVVVQLSW